MKSKLNALLPSPVPNFLFATACILLLALGAASWTAIDSISAEADAGTALVSQLKCIPSHVRHGPLPTEVTKLE